jgi:dTDP-4-amino-4,6-dideoxygalactose transaminase
MINVTKPFLPPQVEYEIALKDVWRRGWLTNNGPLVNELEMGLKDFLGLNHLLYLSNGTIAIQFAIKALDLKGEVITTPFSYVATTSSIVWESCQPVFVDIDSSTLNIDPNKIEAAITPRTTGIVATHVFGNPCDVEAIEALAKKHNLKVIYDAAHCFGTKYKGKSLYNYGDISTASFHATKLFHTIEGGAVMTNDADLTRKMSRLRNFGQVAPDQFETLGINGKNSEFHALMGVINLRYINEILDRRRKQAELYDEKLRNLDVQHVRVLPRTEPNFAYYPIIFKTEEALLKALATLNTHWIYPRRYFYPSLSKLHYINPTASQSCPICEDISSRIICLPLYHELTEEEISFVARLLLRSQNN